MKEKKKYHFWIMLAVLVLSGVVIHSIEITGDAKVVRRDLSEFPSQLGEWRQSGGEQRFDDQMEAILQSDDSILRDYVTPDKRSANLYINYYLSQRAAVTYHSPRNCIPGSGWMLNDPQIIKIKAGDKEFEANVYIMENAGYKAILLYWYQGRGRAVASEFKDKFYTIFDSVTKRRSDGSLVRIIMPFRQGEESSQKKAVTDAMELAGRIAPELPKFIPD